tara:strand:+ start:926 stop:4018 length:3093 start_codon:yes stop_codon:yes gene_type:complete
MAYNVKQLEQLQDMIGTEAEVPNALDRYNAMQLLKRKPIRREDGGDMGLRDSVEEVASKGRYGDTMLIHVNPEEVQGLASIAPLTTNPETGLPEAFAFPLIPVLAGAAIGGIGSAVTGGDPLKGAAMGAVGGFMPAALGAGAGALGLGAAWGGLGAIGQGMLVGGAMGGIRSLFGDSDNPMRDILMGAAMGGMGGALMGGDGGGATPDTSLSEAAAPLGMRQVPTVQPGQQSPSWLIPSGGTGSMAGTGTNIVHGVPVTPSPVAYHANPTMYGQAGAATRPLSTYTNPATTIKEVIGPPPPPPQTWSDVGREANVFSKSNVDSYIGAGEGLRADLGFPVEDPYIDPNTGRRFAEEAVGAVPDAASKEAAATATQDAAEKTGLGAWWDRQGDWTKAGIIGGGGLLASGLLEEDYPEPLEEDDEIVEFPRVDPLPIRTPVQRDRDEILAQYLSSSPTAGQPQSWFTEQDVNVAKQGGLVALDHGGMANLAYAGRNEDNAVHGGEVAHISANESDMLRRMGGAGSINPVTGLREYRGAYAMPSAGAPVGSGAHTAAQGSAAAAAQAASGNTGSGNFGFSIGRGGAVPTQGQPGNLGQPRPGVGYNPLSSSTYGRAQQLANMFSYDPGLTSISNMPLLQGTLALLGHAAEKGSRVGTLGSLASLGALGEGAQNLANAPTFSRGDVGTTSSDVSGPVSLVNTQTQGGNQGVGIGQAVTETALPPVVGQANGGIVGLFSGGEILPNGIKVIKGKSGLGAGSPGSGGSGLGGPPGTSGGAAVGAHELTHGAAHPSGHPHPAQIGQPQVVFYGRRRGSSGSGAPPPPVEEEIEARRFTVNPFNVQERLGAITGSSAPVQIPNLPAQQITLPTEASGALQGLLQRASDLPIVQAPISEVGTTAIEEQGNAALDNLLLRAADLPQVQESADGGVVGLATGGNTPVFEGRVMGQGDGMDDDVAFGVVPQTPADIPNTPDMALLSSDEYVMPADVVSMLGNGSSTAGSKILDQFNQLLRKKAHGTNKQQTQLDAGRELSSLV